MLGRYEFWEVVAGHYSTQKSIDFFPLQCILSKVNVLLVY